MQLHFEHQADGTGLLRLSGELTIYHAAELKAALLPLADDGAHALVVDLSGVSDIDSAGLQLLLATRRTLAGRGASLRLDGCDGAVGEALALYGMAPA
ncbi:MAG: STAS domain-containing protein [Janthinobacterium lividum]